MNQVMMLLYTDGSLLYVLKYLLVCGIFLLTVFIVAVFIILAHSAQTRKRIKEAEISRLVKDLEKENYEKILKLNDVYRKYMHDVHQYFYQFRSLALSGENRAIIDIIDAWEGNLGREESNMLYSGSAVINSLLSRCVDNAKERQIELDIFVEDALDLDFIQDVDKISMFGNLLDNAMEAAGECEEGKRKINIRMFMGNNHCLVFRMENTWSMKPRRAGGKLLSTKRDSENHGLGIGIARELARRYGGSLELEEQGEWFVTTLIAAR